jgi:hypothetical protein
MAIVTPRIRRFWQDAAVDFAASQQSAPPSTAE